MLSGFTMDNSLSIIHGWFHDILLIGVTRSQAYLKKTGNRSQFPRSTASIARGKQPTFGDAITGFPAK